jgi:hypothetical protein
MAAPALAVAKSRRREIDPDWAVFLVIFSLLPLNSLFWLVGVFLD